MSNDVNDSAFGMNHGTMELIGPQNLPDLTPSPPIHGHEHSEHVFWHEEAVQNGECHRPNLRAGSAGRKTQNPVGKLGICLG